MCKKKKYAPEPAPGYPKYPFHIVYTSYCTYNIIKYIRHNGHGFARLVLIPVQCDNTFILVMYTRNSTGVPLYIYISYLNCHVQRTIIYLILCVKISLYVGRDRTFFVCPVYGNFHYRYLVPTKNPRVAVLPMYTVGYSL